MANVKTAHVVILNLNKATNSPEFGSFGTASRSLRDCGYLKIYVMAGLIRVQAFGSTSRSQATLATQKSLSAQFDQEIAAARFRRKCDSNRPK